MHQCAPLGADWITYMRSRQQCAAGFGSELLADSWSQMSLRYDPHIITGILPQPDRLLHSVNFSSLPAENA